jgi:DNA-binding SARP family transcriptional activator
MRVAVLGDLRVWGDDQEERQLAPRLCQLLLILVLHLNEVVSTDRLADAIWEGQQPRHAEHAVQTAIFRLRNRLGQESGSPSAHLVTRSTGYSLILDAERVDAHEFEIRLAAVREELRRDHTQSSAAELRSILTLWRGDPYMDVSYLDFAQPEIRRLRELHLAARQALIEVEIEADRGEAMIADLEGLTIEHPLREPLWVLLFTALSEAGRSSEVIPAFDRAQAILAADHKIEASAQLGRTARSLASGSVDAAGITQNRATAEWKGIDGKTGSDYLEYW